MISEKDILNVKYVRDSMPEEDFRLIASLTRLLSVAYRDYPVKPINYDGHKTINNINNNALYCGRCGRASAHVEVGYNFCPNCGGRIQWEQ